MSRRLAALALAALLLLGGAACKQPDPAGGCSRHPGECGRDR